MATVFAPELFELDRSQVRRWYNGYNWTGESVYNPFDLLLLFENRLFRSWWFETATPTFLIKLLAERGFFTPDLTSLCTGEALLWAFDIENIGTEALLFQTAYLTITGQEEPDLGMVSYTLGYPNREVEISLNSSLRALYTNDASKNHRHGLQLRKLLRSNDLAGLRQLIHAFFAGSPDRSIPHQWYTNNPIAQYEGFYASVFYSYFAALGFDVVVEDATNHGRIDIVVLLPKHIYLVCGTRLEKIGTRDVLMLKRFDREWDGERQRYIKHGLVSGLTVIDAEDGYTGRERWSYLLLADEMRRWSAKNDEDRRELFRRMAFNAMVTNNDDHPRNHALLHTNGGWRLSPAYDIVPIAMV